MSTGGHSLAQTAEAGDLADRARLCYDADLLPEAADLLKQAMALDPTLLEGRLLEARVRLAQMQGPLVAALGAERAAHGMNGAEEHDPVVALLDRSWRLWQAGQRELARAALPDKPAGRFALLRRQAAMDVLLDRNEAAEAALRMWLNQQGDAQAVRRVLARLVARSRLREGVSLMLGARPTAMPSYLRYWSARVLARGRATADAERLVIDLLEDHPHDATLWRLAGRLAARAGQDAVAAHRLEMSAHLGQTGEAARSLMRLHLRAGRFPAAGAWAWRRLRRSRPRCRALRAEAWSVLAVSAILSGRRRLARRARHEAIRLVGRLGWQTLRRQVWQHAAAGLVLGRALTVDEAGPAAVRGHESPLRRLLGFACERLGVHTTAWPHRADAFHHLAACRQALGEVDAAAAANNTALSLNPHYREALALQRQLHNHGDRAAA